LLTREFDGERNVLNTRISSLEKTVEQQTAQLIKLSQQLETAYQKVQDIALKAVEGSATVKSVAGLQQLMNEQMRKPTQEK
jgi:predicted RNase H-like nuclease (RuvC/YqgF family)